MKSFGLSPDKVEKLYHQALRLNQLTSSNNHSTIKKTTSENNKITSRPSGGRNKPSILGTVKPESCPSMFDQPLREWEVFKYGDDYGFGELPESEPSTSSPKNLVSGELNTEDRIASSNTSDLQSSGDQSTSEDDGVSPDFISVLDSAESIGEKFVKEIRSMKQLFSSNDSFKNQFEKVFCSLRREKIKLEIDLLQSKRCIESLKNQLVIVQEEADQCRRELDEERSNSALKVTKLMKRFTENKALLEKAQRQLAVRRNNLFKENLKSSSTGQLKSTVSPLENKSVKENGEPMDETAGSPESCHEAQDDSTRSRNGKSPVSSSSVDMNLGLNGDFDGHEELDLSNACHPVNLSPKAPTEPFEVTLEDMGLEFIPSEATDPCICAAIVMTKGRIILHNLKRSEYLATIYEYRKFRPEFTERQGLPFSSAEEDYDFVNMLPGLWFNSNIDGWFIGNETPEERNKPHPRLPDYILLEGLIPVEKSLYVQNVVMKEDVKHATQVASVLVRRVLPDVYVKNALLSGNTLKDEYPPAKCFIESLANGLPLGVGYRRFLAIQAHAFRVIGKYGPLSYIEIQSVRTTISKCLKERRRDDRRSGLKRKRSATVLPSA